MLDTKETLQYFFCIYVFYDICFVFPYDAINLKA